MKLWLVPFAVATLAGCVSIPAKPSADGGVICVYPEPGGTSLCQAATNLTAKQVTNQTSLCTMQGTLVAACPEGAVGCCATTLGSVDFDKCDYGISAATGQMACATAMGTWTPTSAPSEAGATDAPSEAGATDAPSDAGATDAPSEAGATD
jgi:hypothetical protein